MFFFILNIFKEKESQRTKFKTAELYMNLHDIKDRVDYTPMLQFLFKEKKIIKIHGIQDGYAIRESL